MNSTISWFSNFFSGPTSKGGDSISFEETYLRREAISRSSSGSTLRSKAPSPIFGSLFFEGSPSLLRSRSAAKRRKSRSDIYCVFSKSIMTTLMIILILS